jgi:hypothetical protein
MRCTNRSIDASRISSRFPRRTATSRCTPCCWARSARRSKCRSARRNGLGRRARRRRTLGLQDRQRSGQQRAGARARVAVLAGRQLGATHVVVGVHRNVKIDLFPDEVYLFTPRGDILSLPRNATALDFAYAVHTDVGDHAVAARVDKKLLPLRTRLDRASWWKSSPRRRRCRIRHGWSRWLPARRAPRSASI